MLNGPLYKLHSHLYCFNMGSYLQTPLQTPLPGQTPLQGTTSTPLPGTVDTSYNITTVGTPITPNDYPRAVGNGTSGNPSGRPSQHMVIQYFLTDNSNSVAKYILGKCSLLHKFYFI